MTSMKAEESEDMKRQERLSERENIDTIRDQIGDKTNQSVRIFGARQSLAGTTS
jgi:hypothetical protein